MVGVLDAIYAIAYAVVFVPVMIITIQDILSNSSGFPFIVNELTTISVWVTWLILFILVIGGSQFWIALKKHAVIETLIDIIDMDDVTEGT